MHGSQEHQAFLRTSQQHHSSRREALRRRFGADFDEWERVAADLDAVDAQLERLADHSASLGSNFAKFGYSAHLRTYGGDEPAPTPTPPLSRSPSTSSASIAGGADARAPWEDRANGTAPRLFRRPVIKQYFHRGLLWRASEETRVQSFELFFDLLYVGIIALNGDHASEDATGRELLRFVITFCMSWKIWTDLAQFISWFETDDIMQRLEFLFLIACLLGCVHYTSTLPPSLPLPPPNYLLAGSHDLLLLACSPTHSPPHPNYLLRHSRSTVLTHPPAASPPTCSRPSATPPTRTSSWSASTWPPASSRPPTAS